MVYHWNNDLLHRLYITLVPAFINVENIYRDLGIQLERCSDPEGSSDIGNVSHRCPA